MEPGPILEVGQQINRGFIPCGKLMLGFSVDRNVIGTTIRFRPVWDKFITNGKGMGMSITLRSPIEFHITLADKRRRRRYKIQGGG